MGHFEQVILTAVASLGEYAYGITVHAKAEELASPRTFKRGAVYATLDRLEYKGLLWSCFSEPLNERGGRSRRYYRLQEQGKKALQDAFKTTDRLYAELRQGGEGYKWRTT